jgi:hypothetical protein
MKKLWVILGSLLLFFFLPFLFWGPSWKDSDDDGVPNHLDKCPNTSSGIKVDAWGCPADSDGDWVIDSRDGCPDTPQGVQVDSDGCPMDADLDGVYDGHDKCPGTEPGISVDENGCPLDSDRDGVNDDVDQCAGTPLGARVDERGCWVVQGIQFDPGKWDIPIQAYPILDEVVAVLDKNSSLTIEIQGHTDNIGSEEANRAISAKRAKAVSEYFVEKGIGVERLSAVGYGPSSPIAENDTPEGRAKNRRVDKSEIGNRKSEIGNRRTCDLRPVTCDLRLATCNLRPVS